MGCVLGCGGMVVLSGVVVVICDGVCKFVVECSHVVCVSVVVRVGVWWSVVECSHVWLCVNILKVVVVCGCVWWCLVEGGSVWCYMMVCGGM